eukprot:429888_1
MFLCPCRPKLKKNIDALHFNSLETPNENITKIVLLGPSDSGKTTILKQLRKISGSLDNTEINNMASLIKESIVTNMKQLCFQSLLLEKKSTTQTTVNPNIQHLRDDMLSFTQSELLTPDIAYKIRQLWSVDAIRATLQQRHLFQIDENVRYFFDKMEDIASDDYVPSFEDFVRMRRISSGYSMTKFMKSYMNQNHFFEVLDIGGARCERKKWWANNLLLDMDLNAVIYTVPISDYNLTLFEDNKTNRLTEAITLFRDTMVRSDCFNDVPLFLLFNKYDVFVDKIKEIPITCCFKDFPVDTMDACDPDQVIHFVAVKFGEVLKDCDVKLKGPLRIYKTSAVDTESIERMFNKLMPHIMRQNVGKYPEIH